MTGWERIRECQLQNVGSSDMNMSEERCGQRGKGI